MKLNIITTATIRPKILNNTYSNFKKYMNFEDDVKLIINIDPIGETYKYNQKSVLKIAKKHFKNINYNLPEKPSFAKAVKWCWNNIDNDCEYVFILEDDWTVTRKININHMIEIHKKNPKLASLKLSKTNLKKSKKSILNGFIHEDKLSFNPNLIKAEFIRECSKLISENSNPEKQMRIKNPKLKHIIEKWKYGIYVGNGYDKLVIDIGRKWMAKSHFKKKTGFVNWEKKYE